MYTGRTSVTVVGERPVGVAGFIAGARVHPYMQCHYCDRAADITVEKEGIRVGVCEDHFRKQMEELSDADWLDGLDDELDIDRSE